MRCAGVLPCDLHRDAFRRDRVRRVVVCLALALLLRCCVLRLASCVKSYNTYLSAMFYKQMKISDVTPQI